MGTATETQAGSSEAREKAEARQPATEVEAAPEDPAVAAILATKPTTPAECVRAAKTLADLGHPDVAKQLLKKVLDAKLAPQQLADLGEQFGVADVSRPGRPAALLPEAKQLADAVTAGSDGEAWTTPSESRR